MHRIEAYKENNLVQLMFHVTAQIIEMYGILHRIKHIKAHHQSTHFKRKKNERMNNYWTKPADENADHLSFLFFIRTKLAAPTALLRGEYNTL